MRPAVASMCILILAASGCVPKQTCDAALAQHARRSDEIVSAHAAPCVDDADCVRFALDVRCDEAGVSEDNNRVAIGGCPMAVAATNAADAQSELDAFRDELCASNVEACSNGDFDCAGELACRDGTCIIEL